MRKVLLAILIIGCGRWQAPGLHYQHNIKQVDSLVVDGEVKYRIFKCVKYNNECKWRDTFPHPKYHIAR